MSDYLGFDWISFIGEKFYHNGLFDFIGIFSNDFIKRVNFPENIGPKMSSILPSTCSLLILK